MIHKLVGAPGESNGAGGSGAGLTIIKLLGPSSSAAAPQAEQHPPPASPNPSKSELDTTIASDVPKPEWSLVRILVPPEPAKEASPSPLRVAVASLGGASGAGHASSGTNAGDGGAGATGGGGYEPFDPYVGAAPMRRPQDNVRPPALDQALFAAVVRKISNAFPSADGSVDLVARIGEDGKVLEVSTASASLPAPAIAALKQALVGLKLFQSGRASPNIPLPTITI